MSTVGLLQAKLAGAGIEGLDFSDARCPQALYGEADGVFRPLEKRVREMLTQSGYQDATLSALDEMRAAAAPSARHEGLEREVLRLREVLRRVETREAYLLARYAFRT